MIFTILARCVSTSLLASVVLAGQGAVTRPRDVVVDAAARPGDVIAPAGHVTLIRTAILNDRPAVSQLQ